MIFLLLCLVHHTAGQTTTTGTFSPGNENFMAELEYERQAAALAEKGRENPAMDEPDYINKDIYTYVLD